MATKYNDRKDYIKQLKQARNKDHFVDLVEQMSKQVNQRLYRLEKAGVGIGDTAYKFAQLETGKDKPRYTVSRQILENMSNEDLYERALQLNSKLVSKTSTITGIKEVTENRLSQSIESLEDSISDKNINKKEFDDFLRAGGGELMNSKYYDSVQIVEDWLEWRDKKLTTKEIIDEFKKQQSKAQKYAKKGKRYDIDMGKINRDFKSLANKKSKQAIIKPSTKKTGVVSSKIKNQSRNAAKFKRVK